MICFQAKNCNSKYSKYGKKKASGKDSGMEIWKMGKMFLPGIMGKRKKKKGCICPHGMQAGKLRQKEQLERGRKTT